MAMTSLWCAIAVAMNAGTYTLPLRSGDLLVEQFTGEELHWQVTTLAARDDDHHAIVVLGDAGRADPSRLEAS